MRKNYLRDQFVRVRRKLDISEDIKHNNIRDAAYTIVGGVKLDAARILAGHGLGGSADHYFARHHEHVKDACRAIERVFFG